MGGVCCGRCVLWEVCVVGGVCGGVAIVGGVCVKEWLLWEV